VDGPTPEQIAAWKKEYTNIYSVSFKDKDYVFREITFAEFDDITLVQDAEGSAEAEEHLVTLALLHPAEGSVQFDRMSAGIVSSLASEILEYSGFGSVAFPRKKLNEFRQGTNELRVLMKAFVLATMPSYKEEELDQLTFTNLAKKVVLSEEIIRVNQAAFGMEPNEITLDLIDPEEEAEKEREAAMKHAAQKKPGQAGYHDPIADQLHQALG